MQSAVNRVNMPAAYIKDGGGKMSSGDWSTIPASEQHREDSMQDLRKELMQIIEDCDLHKKLLANISQRSKAPPWDNSFTDNARNALLEWMGVAPGDESRTLGVAPG